MKLEEIQQSWNKMDDMFDHSSMTEHEIKEFVDKQNTFSQLRVWIPEVLIIMFFAYLILLLVIFNKEFDSMPFKIVSAVTVLALVIQVILIINTSRVFRSKVKLSDSFNHTINHLKTECKKLNANYRLIIGLNFISLILCIVLLPRIYQEVLTFQQILLSYALGAIILGGVSYKIYRYYKRLLVNNSYLNKRLFSEK